MKNFMETGTCKFLRLLKASFFGKKCPGRPNLAPKEYPNVILGYKLDGYTDAAIFVFDFEFGTQGQSQRLANGET